MVTSITNAVEFGLFITIGLAGLIAFYATLVVVFRSRRRQGNSLLLSVVGAILLACLMLFAWPVYLAYRMWRRFRPASPYTAIR